MKKSTGFLMMVCMLSACAPKSVNKFNDPQLVKIANLQDRRLSDSLYVYFEHENPVYRKEAALAFASVQDTVAADRLGELLHKETDPEVKKAAAIALGQTPGKPSAAILLRALQTEKNPDVLREILESCGKTFSAGDVAQLHIISPDSLIHEGLAWAYYRLGLRNLADSTLTLKAIDFLKSEHGLQTRLGAASFFIRGAPQVSLVEAQLIESARHDTSPWVRATVTSALRKTQSAAALAALKEILKADDDYRVRINAVKALQAFPVADVKTDLFGALKDSNINVAIAASEVILALATPAEANETAALAKASTQNRVRGNLYQASLAGSDNVEQVSQIKAFYQSESDSYGKAALLTALGKSKVAWAFVEEQMLQSAIPVIKSTAAAALVAIDRSLSVEPSVKKLYAESYVRAIQTGDAAVIGTVTDALRDPRLGYKDIITDYTFLYEAKSMLSLPKDNEALQPLEAAIAYFEGKKGSNPVKNEFNHPINWELVKTIPKDQRVLIQTNKGDIVLRLLVEEAPGSVANFVQLVNSKYFDARYFHRVVPNFVIQAGCNRGDGWGSEDYSIRSEFTQRHYTEGAVGMASAGKDTEGTQWFITHSPTPHLDGRYSIFAVTESGMEVVHQIEVGDTILSAILVK